MRTKQVTLFLDTENKIDQLSREVFKNTDKEVHYPREFEGGQKYLNIKKITYKGFEGSLPVGVVRSYKLGLGFTKT